MNFHVSGKITAMTESFVTNRAHTGSLTSVSSQMYSQALFPLKSFITNIVRVSYLFR